MNDDADLKAALATTEEARDRWHQKYTVEAQARKDETQVLGDALTALRDRLAALERELAEARAEAKEQKTLSAHLQTTLDTWQKQIRRLQAENDTARAEVESVARWFFDMGRTGEHPHGTVFDAAWSRYQQERTE